MQLLRKIFGTFTLATVSTHTLLIALMSTHLFCCVMPTLVSVAGLLSGLGFIGLTGVAEELHHHMHDFELPILIFSFVMLCLGWGLETYRQRAHTQCCHHTGCSHQPCTPKKNRAHIILVVATLLFLVNIAVYLGENIF